MKKKGQCISYSHWEPIHDYKIKYNPPKKERKKIQITKYTPDKTNTPSSIILSTLVGGEEGAGTDIRENIFPHFFMKEKKYTGVVITHKKTIKICSKMAIAGLVYVSSFIQYM